MRNEFDANQALSETRPVQAWQKPAPKRDARIVRRCWVLRLLGV